MAAEQLDLGGAGKPAGRRRSRSTGARLVAVVAIVCIAAVSTSWWRHAHSLTADQVSTAVHTFTPVGVEGTTLQVNALTSAPVHPAQCQPVTDLGLTGAHQQFSWWNPTPSSPPPNQLVIGRYPTGAAARQAWNSLITALNRCEHQPITPARTGTKGSALISVEPRTLSQQVNRLWFWQLHSTEQANDTSLAARRYGNIIVICLGPPDATQQSRADLLRAFVEKLAHKGRHRTTRTAPQAEGLPAWACDPRRHPQSGELRR